MNLLSITPITPLILHRFNPVDIYPITLISVWGVIRGGGFRRALIRFRAADHRHFYAYPDITCSPLLFFSILILRSSFWRFLNSCFFSLYELMAMRTQKLRLFQRQTYAFKLLVVVIMKIILLLLDIKKNF